MNINICLRDTVANKPDLFIEAVNAYRDWCKSGKDHKTAQHLFDVWDKAVAAYCEVNDVRRSVVVDMVYRAVEAELKDERIK